MLRIIRQRFLTKALGGSFTSAIALGWILDKVKDIFDDDPEDIEMVALRPGESYQVVARPAMSKREAKLFAEEQKLKAKAAKVSRPTSKELKAAKKLSRAQRKLAKSKPGTKREQKRLMKAEAAGAKFDKANKATRESKKRKTLSRALTEVSAERQQLREAALAEVPKKRRRPSIKTYR